MVQKLGLIFGRNFKDLVRHGEATARFSGYYMQDPLVCFVDENCWGGNREMLGDLKALITEPVRFTEKKGEPIIMVDNYANLIFASNEDHIVPYGPGSRRWFPLATKNTHAGRQTDESRAYFARILSVDARAFAHFLYERDISAFKTEIVPMTEAAQSQIEHSMSTVAQWWAYCLKHDVGAIRMRLADGPGDEASDV